MVTIPGISDSMDQVIEDDVTTAEGPSGGKTVEVVLTGFGPFRNIIDNPSFKIAQALPPEILIGGEDGVKIKVVRHPTPVHVAYQTVVKLIPRLYDQHSPKHHPHATRSEPQSLPFFVHIGAGYNGEYALEEQAHRDGYSKLDVDEQPPPIQSNDKEKRGFPILDEYADEIFQTGIDVDGVVDDADGEIADVPMPLNVSHDAGNYLCDFIYYTSLYEATKRWGPDGRKQVLFVHVPPDGKLEDGVRVLTAVLRGIARRAQ